MSSFNVTIERLEISPHTNADALELAQVGLYRAVVPKGVYKTGDYAIYIPEQAIVPHELLEELDLVGKLAGKEKNRVKAIRLRGELSQGIVCRPKAMDYIIEGSWEKAGTLTEQRRSGPVPLIEVNYADALGITKWVPPIPTQMAGKVYAADRLLRWVDIENIKRHPNIFQAGEPIVATEKVHGTCFMLTFDASDEGSCFTTVSSKGYGKQGLAIERDAGNLYWRAVNAYSLEAFADKVSLVAGAPIVALFGEVYGGGVQDLTYGTDVSRGAPGFALFDIAVDYGDGIQVFLSPDAFRYIVEQVNDELVDDSGSAVPMVPVLYEGPYDEQFLLQLAEGSSVVEGANNIREGLVVRPAKEAYSPVTGGRKIGKIVSEGYLTRKGATTEFE